MRNVVWAITMLVACGPSAAEVKTARQTVYRADPGTLFELAMSTTRETYKIADVNKEDFSFITESRWYSPEGDLESPGAGGFVTMVDRSVAVSFIVQVTPSETHGDFGIVVIPKTFQHLEGSPKPRELPADDPNLPTWIHGRVDALALAIYQRAKGYAVAPPGQTSPST